MNFDLITFFRIIGLAVYPSYSLERDVGKKRYFETCFGQSMLLTVSNFDSFAFTWRKLLMKSWTVYVIHRVKC